MTQRPRILLVGAGRFGQHHLRVLRTLERKKLITLAGVVVRLPASATRLAKETGLPVYTQLSSALLKTVDAVDIVTPYPTHEQLVKRCLPHAHVFVEKPLTASTQSSRALAQLAKKHRRVLMVGHIYRYHATVKELANLIRKKRKNLRRVECSLLTPRAQWRGESAPLEKLHWFDFLDMVFGKKPDALWATGDVSDCAVSLRYGNTDAAVKLGWPLALKEKERSITLTFERETAHADFVAHTLTTERGGKKSVRAFPHAEPLERELRAFVELVRGSKAPYPNGEIGGRAVALATQVEQALTAPKKRIAVIGGGLFGTTAALELSKLGQVTLFERGSELMSGATRANQYRHHVGYHYPRSLETIKEIKEATKDFESLYKKAIVRHPAYYAVAKKGSLMSAKEFLAVCKQAGLPHKHTTLPSDVLNPHEVTLTIKTSEAVLDYAALKKDIEKKLRAAKVGLKLEHRVTNAQVNNQGEKVLTLHTKRGTKKQVLDYVVNATYHNHNDFCGWLNFPQKDLELRLKELPIVRLPLKKPLAITVMDGPFATFVPVGNTGLYTFGDVPLSVHATARGKNAAQVLEKKKLVAKSRWPAMQKRCQKWFPLLKDAEYVKSMFVILPVEKWTSDTDARPTEVTDHGFGCYSILSGKLITAVSAARQIVDKIE